MMYVFSYYVQIAASVVGVGSGRRGSSVHNTSNEIVLKEKFNLTIKETPNKDAQSVHSTSIRSGFLMKRNEQGSLDLLILIN